MPFCSYLVNVERKEHPLHGPRFDPAGLDLAHACPGYVRAMAPIDGDRHPHTVLTVEADDFGPLEGLPDAVKIGKPQEDYARYLTSLDEMPLDARAHALFLERTESLGVSIAPRKASLGPTLRRLLRRLEPAAHDGMYDLAASDVAQTITDDFNRVSLGSGWTSLAGGWTINASTTARPTSVYSTCLMTRSEASFPNDQYAQADITIHVTGDRSFGGVVARVADTSNYYVVWLNGAAGSISSMELDKHVGGVNSYITDAAVTGVFDTLYTVKLDCTGTTIAAFFGGVQKLSGTDSALAAGKPGVYQATGDAPFADADNWQSTDAASVAAAAMRSLMGIGL